MRSKIKPTLRFILFHKQKGKCIWCKQEMWLNKRCLQPKHLKATLEHLVPKSKGGRIHFSNIVAACRKCNNGRENYMKNPHDGSTINPEEILQQLWNGEIDDFRKDNPKWAEIYAQWQKILKASRKEVPQARAAA